MVDDAVAPSAAMHMTGSQMLPANDGEQLHSDVAGETADTMRWPFKSASGVDNAGRSHSGRRTLIPALRSVP